MSNGDYLLQIEAKVDICAFSEVRHPGTGNVVERSYTIFWSGGEDRTAGIGFAISNKLAAQGISPTPVSDRLMTMCIQLKNGERLTLISVHAPTMQCTFEECFYDKLGSCTSAAEKDLVIILGDSNARVEKDWKSWPTWCWKDKLQWFNALRVFAPDSNSVLWAQCSN